MLHTEPTIADAPWFDRAQTLVDAMVADRVVGIEGAEHRTVVSSNRWRHASGKVTGTAIGFRRTGGRWTDEHTLTVFVNKKFPRSQLGHDEIIPASITVSGHTVPIDVLQVGALQPHLRITGAVIRPAKQSAAPGRAAGILRDVDGLFYILSAAHVLGETRANGTHLWLHPGTPVLHDQSDGPIGQLVDRAVPDFSNTYGSQNVDAAIALLKPQYTLRNLPAPPYSGPAVVNLGDRVTTALADNPSPVFGTVRLKNAALSYTYLDGVNKRPREVRLMAAALAEYTSLPGDSGAMVYRHSDEAAVGMHLAAQPFRDESGQSWLAVFQPIQQILRQWPELTLIHK